MYLSHVEIENFRAIERFSIDLSQFVNVIVGPNGVGKTNVLQAIRLVKSLFAPRTQSEAQQTLVSLGASSPHVGQRILLSALMRDVEKNTSIRLTLIFSIEEWSILKEKRGDLARVLAINKLGQGFLDAATAIRILGSSEGKDRVAEAQSTIDKFLDEGDSSRQIVIGLTINATSKQIEAVNPLGALLVAQLDTMQPPNVTKFSYFPADRALPFGEVAVQLGANDFNQQIESHNSQPQLKYSRLKNLMFNTLVMDPVKRQSFENEFNRIFSNLLRGRSIKNLSINELGLLSVVTQAEDGRLVELDNLSSGEKNLILSLLLIDQTVANGGIVLFDEPELHLNPTICREFISSLIQDYAVKKGKQVILCTHSSEMLKESFLNDHASLFQVRSPKEISRIGPIASDEYVEALSRLGVSATDGLSYQGTFLVEGEDDVEYLRTIFPELLRRYLIKPLGGRKEVEKAAEEFQRLEIENENLEYVTAIIDLDDRKSDLKNSSKVKVLQWDRFCIDNFLIDIDIITVLLKNKDITSSTVASQGEANDVLRKIAFGQIQQKAARNVFRGLCYKSPSARAEDFSGSTLEEMGAALWSRVTAARASLDPVAAEDSWREKFESACHAEIARLRLEWDGSWTRLCDGKRFFDDAHKQLSLKMSKLQFKKRVIAEMREHKSQNYRLMESLVVQNMPGGSR